MPYLYFLYKFSFLKAKIIRIHENKEAFVRLLNELQLIFSWVLFTISWVLFLGTIQEKANNKKSAQPKQSHAFSHLPAHARCHPEGGGDGG